MGGPSRDSGSSDRPNTTRSTVTKVRKNPIKQAADFISKGGITGAIVRGITQGISKKNKTSKSGDVYGGSAYGYNEAAEKKDYNRTSTLSNRDDNNQKSAEQPKVKSQMSNTDVKSDMITAKAPAAAEMTADEILLKNKRKGRKSTVLTSVSGVDAYPTLSKKTLLG